jgi:hypothetical protein
VLIRKLFGKKRHGKDGAGGAGGGKTKGGFRGLFSRGGDILGGKDKVGPITVRSAKLFSSFKTTVKTCTICVDSGIRSLPVCLKEQECESARIVL